MKNKESKVIVSIILILIILFSICPKVFATNGNEMSISSKTGIGNTVEIISGNTNSIKSESVADVVSYLSGQNITVNSIVNHKGASVDLASTALIGTGYVLNTNNGNYSVIVYGDANGDGEADAGDMKVIIDNFLGINQASPIAKIAVDLYQDGDLDAADLKQVLDSFLGNLTGSIVKTTNASNPTPTPDVSVTPTPVPTSTGSGPQIVVDGQAITLTKANVQEYYGQVVTNYSATNSATWRLFYVDFDGDFGDEGKIYLKADEVMTTELNPTASISSITALNKMKQMNPDWAANDGVIDVSNERGVIWLFDETKWTNYKDVSKADCVIGAPSIEMYVKSYNAYHSKKGTSGYQQLNCKWYDDTGIGCTRGYKYGFGTNVTDYIDYKYYSLSEDENNMYIKSNEVWWIASPNAMDDDCVCNVSCSISGLNNSTYHSPCGVCPLASLKSGIIPEIYTPTPTPTPIPTQVTGNFSTPYDIVFDVCDANNRTIKYSDVNLVIALYDGGEVSSMYQMMTNADGKCTISNVTTVGKIGISTKNGYDTANNTYVELATHQTTGKIYLAGMNNVGDVSMAGNQLTIQVLATQQY